MLFIILVFAFVLPSILPQVNSRAMHDPIAEFALEAPPIAPLEFAVTTHFILVPQAFVLAPIGPIISALALFDPLVEEPIIEASIAPNLHTQASVPLTVAVSTIFSRFENLQPSALIDLPCAFECLSLRCLEYTDPNVLVVKPEALKHGAIWPLQHAVARSDWLLFIEDLDLTQVAQTPKLQGLKPQLCIPHKQLLILFE